MISLDKEITSNVPRTISQDVFTDTSHYNGRCSPSKRKDKKSIRQDFSYSNFSPLKLTSGNDSNMQSDMSYLHRKRKERENRVYSPKYISDISLFSDESSDTSFSINSPLNSPLSPYSSSSAFNLNKEYNNTYLSPTRSFNSLNQKQQNLSSSNFEISNFEDSISLINQKIMPKNVNITPQPSMKHKKLHLHKSESTSGRNKIKISKNSLKKSTKNSTKFYEKYLKNKKFDRFDKDNSRFLLIETPNYDNAIAIAEEELQKIQICNFSGQLSIFLRMKINTTEFQELKSGLFSLINDYGYNPSINPKHPTTIVCQISTFLSEVKESKVISLPIANISELINSNHDEIIYNQKFFEEKLNSLLENNKHRKDENPLHRKSKKVQSRNSNMENEKISHKKMNDAKTNDEKSKNTNDDKEPASEESNTSKFNNQSQNEVNLVDGEHSSNSFKKMIEEKIKEHIYDDSRFVFCMIPDSPITDAFLKFLYIKTVTEVCSSFECQCDVIDKTTPLIQCETKRKTVDTEIVSLPILNPDKADRMIKEKLQSNFSGVIIFQPENGQNYHKVLMSRYPRKIVDICESFGFDADITDIKNQIVKCSMIKKNTTSSSKLPKIVIRVSSFDSKKAENTVRRTLQSGFNGIIIFKPEKGFYSQSQMPNFPKRIIDICHQFRALARIIKSKNSNDSSNNHTYSCSNSCQNSYDNIINRESNHKTNNQFSKLENNSECKNNEVNINELNNEYSDGCVVECKILHDRNVFYQNITVEVPWDKPKSAEGIIRLTLEGNFVGTVTFVPEHGVYSELTMSEYPHRIIEICNEYKFEAAEKGKQIVECQKTSSLSNETKTVLLSNFNKFKAEAQIRATLVSNFAGIVIFAPEGGHYNDTLMKDFQNRVKSICQEFQFNAYFGEKESVHCHMRKRNLSEVTLELPLETCETMEEEIKRFFESGFSGTANLVPLGKKYDAEHMKLFYPRKALELCHMYNFIAKVVDIKTKKIQCVVNPLIVELKMTNDLVTKEEVKTSIDSVVNGVVVFIPHPSIYDNMTLRSFSSTISNFCEQLGFTPVASEQKVVCSIIKSQNTNNNNNEKTSINTNMSNNTNNTKNSIVYDNFEESDGTVVVKVPSFDPSTAENVVRSALSKYKRNEVVIMFVPKSLRYNKVSMAKYPQKIIEICKEFELSAKIENNETQIVECNTAMKVENTEPKQNLLSANDDSSSSSSHLISILFPFSASSDSFNEEEAKNELLKDLENGI
ncbi:hypothetical protein TRFO_03140 [Tritrichomonas foetus]|uniref:Uncharacterized protein n=1 Tax=Tritrichomonas foetus TaxID=1144522 RepID=A0A1J4KWM7_9EUKA|nr:hypothetical protein TRFO_03140 [Tritrichomonas foetus]|eukprot:OHT14116.1 hypothetical protein TRFO_03140 [Tritrichomonas foetus]